MLNYQVGKATESGYIEMHEGIKRKTLVFGNHTLLCEFRMAKGAMLPIHKHPQEQSGYLVSGHIILIIDAERHEMRPGDSWTIIGNLEHWAEIKEDSIAVEIFSPVREDFI